MAFEPVTTEVTPPLSAEIIRDALSQLFATSVPASNNAALNAIFATDFLDDGQNRASFLSEVTSSPQNVGIKFTNVTLLGSMSPSTSPTAATLSFVVDQQGRKDTHVFRAKKVSGAWVMAGNGRIAKADALTFARLQNVTSIDSGLLFEIKDSGALGISYAIVKGKGLPVNGALYVNFINNSSFGAATTTGVYTGSSLHPVIGGGSRSVSHPSCRVRCTGRFCPRSL